MFSLFLDWLTTSPEWRLARLYRPSKLGLAVLDAMEAEAGVGEEVGNNRGPHIERWGGKQGQSWCAAVVYAMILVACLRLSQAVPFERTNGARQLFRRAVKAGMLVDYQDIQPGDLVLFDRGDPDRPSERWKAHIGIVSRVIRDGFGRVIGFWYWAGNEGRFPSVVAEYNGTNKARRHGFARLP